MKENYIVYIVQTNYIYIIILHKTTGDREQMVRNATYIQSNQAGVEDHIFHVMSTWIIRRF